MEVAQNIPICTYSATLDCHYDIFKDNCIGTSSPRFVSMFEKCNFCILTDEVMSYHVCVMTGISVPV